jgi:hypothetical protein
MGVNKIALETVKSVEVKKMGSGHRVLRRTFEWNRDVVIGDWKICIIRSFIACVLCTT